MFTRLARSSALATAAVVGLVTPLFATAAIASAAPLPPPFGNVSVVDPAPTDQCIGAEVIPAELTLDTPIKNGTSDYTQTGTLTLQSGATADFTWTGTAKNKSGGAIGGMQAPFLTSTGFGVWVNNDVAQGWTLSSQFSFTNVSPAGATPPSIVMAGSIDGSFGSAFDTYTIEWGGSTGQAQILDPANQLKLSPSGTANNAFVDSGSTFLQPQVINNKLLEWSVVAPSGATSFDFTALGGYKEEGFSYGFADVLCPPQAASYTATGTEGSTLTVPTLEASTDPNGDITTATVGLVDPNNPTGPTVSTVTIPGQGTYTVDPDTGVLTFEPDGGFAGIVDPIEYVITDSEGKTDTGTVSSTIIADDPPVATGDSTTTTPDTPVSLGNITANDTDDFGIDPSTVTFYDPDGKPVLNPDGTPASSYTDPDGNVWTVDSSGVVNFDPDPNFNGEATVNYTVKDTSGQESNLAPLTVTIPAVPPTATDYTVTTPIDTPVEVGNVMDGAADADGTVDPNSVTFQDANGEPVLNADGTPVTSYTVPGEGTWVYDAATGAVTFTPEAGFKGVATVDYTVADNAGNISAPATLIVGVPTLAPITVDDSVTGTAQGEPVTVDPLTNDTAPDAPIDPTTVKLIDPADPDGPPVSSVTVVGKGTWEVDPTTGEVTFTPEPGYTGTTTIDYIVSDTSGNPSQPATITAEIPAFPPVAQDFTVSTPLNTPVELGNVIAAATDQDGTVDPTSLTFQGPDGPVLNTDGTPATSYAVPGEGTWEFDPATGVVTFTPEPGFVGTPTVDYTVADDQGNVSEPATLTVGIPSLPPVAVDDSVTGTVQGQPVIIDDALANDSDPDGTLDPTTMKLVDPTTGALVNEVVIPGEGTWIVDGTGAAQFTPEPGYAGTSEVDYVVFDDSGAESNPATLGATIPVIPPTAPDAALTIDQGETATFDTIAADFADADGTVDPTTFTFLDPAGEPVLGTDGNPATIYAVPGEGTWAVDPAGTVTFTPEDGYTGTASVDYTVTDNQGNDSEPATLDVTVTANPPVAKDFAVTTTVDTPVELGDVVAAATDSDGTVDPDSVTFLDDQGNPVLGTDGNPATSYAVPGEGTWSYDPATGVVTFTPEPGYLGVSTVQYTVADDQGNVSDPATLTVGIPEIPPTAVDDSVTGTVQGDPVSVNVTTNDTDPDGTIDPATVQFIDPTTNEPTTETTITVPGEGVWTLAPDGTVTFTPEDGFDGDATIDYVVSDNNGNVSDPATVTATIPVIPPVAEDFAVSTTPGTPVELGNVVAAATDEDGTVDPTSVTFLDPNGLPVLDPTTGEPATTYTVPGEGTWTFDPATGIVSFAPDPDFTGVAEVTYTVTDDQGNVSDPASLMVGVPAIPPTAVDDSVTGTAQAVPVSVNVTTNDVDPDGTIDPATVQFIDPATNQPTTETTIVVPGEGTWTLAPDGTVTFTPEDGFDGDATIDYVVSDNDGNVSDPATVTATIPAIPPVAEDFATTTPIGTPVEVGDVISAASDEDGTVDPTSITFVDAAGNDVLDPTTGEPATSYTEVGVGTWTFDPATGIVTFSPDAAFKGVATVDYTVTDDQGNESDPATLTVGVPVIPPVAVDDSVTGTAQGEPVTVNVTTNDTDLDGTIDPATVMLVDPESGDYVTEVAVPGEGTWTVDSAGNVTFTPEDGYSGDAMIDYVVSDNDGNLTEKPATVTATIPAIPPVAEDFTVSTEIDTPVEVGNVIAAATDADGTVDPTTITFLDKDGNAVVDGDGNPATSYVVPGEGTWTFDPATGIVTFTPEPTFDGQATASYQVTDDQGNDSEPATLTVGIPIMAPVAVDDTVTGTVQGDPVSVKVTTNDTDPDGTIDPASVMLIDPDSGDFTTTVTVPGEGTWTVDTTGTVTFTPEEGYDGKATIDYVVADNTGNLSEPATVTAIIPATPPTAPDDSLTINQGQTATFDEIASQFTDPDGTVDPATVTFLDASGKPVVDGSGNPATTYTQPDVGTWEVDPATGTVTFTPVDGFSGPTEVNYTVTDNQGNVSEPATLDVTVVANPPTAPDETVTAAPGEPATFDMIVAGITDLDGTVDPATITFYTASGQPVLDPITGNPATSYTVPGEGTWTVDPKTGVVTFTPEPDFNGTATVDYSVTDDQGNESELATLTAIIPSVPPVATPDTGKTTQGTPTTVDVTGNDTDADGTIDPTTVTLIDPATGEPSTTGTVTVPGEGTWTVDPETGEVTFTPDPDFLGTATIDYTVADNAGNESEPAAITIAVQAPPVTTGDKVTVGPGETAKIVISDNDTDLDSEVDPTSIRLIDPFTGLPTTSPLTVPGQGVWRIIPEEGAVTFTPEPGFSGVATIDYTISDIDGNVSNVSPIDVTVLGPPVAESDLATTKPGTPVTMNVIGNDTSEWGTIDPTSVTLIDPATGKPSTSGTVTVKGEGTWTVDPVTGSVTFTPEDGYTGVATISYTVADEHGYVSDPATIMVGVQAKPVAVGDTARGPAGQAITIDVLANDSTTGTVQFIDPTTGEATGSAITIPGKGIWTVDPATGKVTFTPFEGFTGTVSIEYQLTDENGNVSDPATITLTVFPIGLINTGGGEDSDAVRMASGVGLIGVGLLAIGLLVVGLRRRRTN